MLIGYARVSTDDQQLHLQHDALQKAGCEKVYSDQQSGATTERPGLSTVFDVLRPGDTLVIWRLDRLGRSLKHLIQLVEQLDKREVGLKSLQENIDTTTSGGRLGFHLFGALAEFERTLIRERTQAGSMPPVPVAVREADRSCWRLTRENWQFAFIVNRSTASLKSAR